ncbi:MAG: DUF2905 domain-containing protein [Dethiobacteria bacterium]
MIDTEMLGKILLVIGGLIALTGVIFFFLGRFGLGRLPGDIWIQKGNFVFYFPLVSGIVISIVLSILINIFFRR